MLEMAKQKVTLEIIHKDVLKLQKEIALIKQSVMDETELTDYAKKTIEESRKRQANEFISHEEVKRKLYRK